MDQILNTSSGKAGMIEFLKHPMALEEGAGVLLVFDSETGFTIFSARRNYLFGSIVIVCRKINSPWQINPRPPSIRAGLLLDDVEHFSLDGIGDLAHDAVHPFTISRQHVGRWILSPFKFLKSILPFRSAVFTEVDQNSAPRLTLEITRECKYLIHGISSHKKPELNP